MFEGKKVIVRTYSAGVHFGTLAAQSGKEAHLTDVRRIWSWRGANTLNEIALRGVGEGSRVSDTVPDILLTEAIEIIPCSDAAIANLGGVQWKS